MKQDYSQFTEEEQRLLKLADEDNKRIIEAFVKGELFKQDFIFSLHFESSKRECLDYNENLKEVRYHQERIESYANYLEYTKTWYEE